ncbi:MAG TPA: acetylglutamate kinase [Gemmatimonadaceae bacterium]|nr:acetylglutamate kinase [Gemmatimonadaceae bacterium]HUK82050.1 acetylglutamate kinase [Verrucomicrobiae bacterium]
MQEFIDKADVLLEALPYIQRFRSSVFVVKYGGSFMDSPDPKVRSGVAADIVFLETVGINPIVVHGGGKAITTAMEKAGIKAQFVQGMRVTDEETMKCVEEVLANIINRDIVEMIQKLGGKARSFSGKDVFKCRKLLKDGVDLGYVGEVVDVDVEKIRKCLYTQVTPVISPIGLGDDEHAYNINADVAAAKLAMVIGARRLVFLSDVPGLLRNPNNPETLISSLHVSEALELKRQGIIDQGMIPKVDSAVEAVHAGVHRVHFVDGRTPHSVLLEIFTDKGIGTEIVK